MTDADISVKVWRSFVETWKTWKRAVDSNLESMGIGSTMYTMLRHLHEDGPMPMAEIAGLLMVTPGWITGLVDSLEERGLVERIRNKEDRRIIDIRITDAGTSLYKKASEVHMAFIKECLEQLDDSEALLLLENMEKLRQAVAKRKKALKNQ
jgi:DNA-binding MarR family transcriptional regulator